MAISETVEHYHWSLHFQPNAQSNWSLLMICDLFCSYNIMVGILLENKLRQSQDCDRTIFLQTKLILKKIYYCTV